MNTKAFAVAASLWIPMVAFAATDASVTEQQEALNERLDQILAKNGISIGGQFRGEIGASTLGGNGEIRSQRSDEQIGYTSVDFDLRARPNTATTARAVFRMHLDHNNFFGTPYAPFETRWLSLDGGAMDMMYYHLGTIQQRWTPLTMWSAEPSFMFTPRIFADQQKAAMAERFIGGNNRNLQGFNAGLRAAVPSISIDSFDVGLLAAKLLSAAPMAAPVAGNITSSSGPFGDGTAVYPDSLGNFDRWALGAQAKVAFLKGIKLGMNYIQVKDLKSTFGTADTAKVARRNHFTKADSAGIVRVLDSSDWKAPLSSLANVLHDSLAQDGRVLSFVLGADAASVLGNNSLILGLDAEAALSSWQTMSSRELTNNTSAGTVNTLVRSGWTYSYTTDTGRYQPVYSQQTGAAINVAVNAGWKTDSWTAKVTAGFLSNDSLFRSDLAQSPIFGKARIYNSEQDYSASNITGLMHYNTFDAMYHTTHRWIAEDRNTYAKSPYDKIAYSNYASGQVTNPGLGFWTAVTNDAYKGFKEARDTVSVKKARGEVVTAGEITADSAAQLALYQAALEFNAWDRELQLVLPVGEASANRAGPKFGLNFDLMQGGVEVRAQGYMLQEVKGSIYDSLTQTTSAEKAKFQQIQAGVRVRADKFISGWTMPIEISGSLGQSTAKGGISLDYASTAINAGLYAGVMKRVAVTAGYQSITGADKAFGVNRNLTNLAAGLEFKVQEGAALVAMYNLLKTEYPNATEYNFDQNIWSTKIAVSF